MRFSEPYLLNIYHWVIMSNHFHLAVEAINPRDLSQLIGKVCSRYSIYYHQGRGGSGRLWQERFQTTVVQKQGSLSKLGRYMK